MEATPQLILAGHLLQFTSDELEEAIARELADNPALELAEEGRCTVCGALFSGKRCPFLADHPTIGSEPSWSAEPYRDAAAPEENWEDPLSNLPSDMSLQEYLLWLMRPHLREEELGIAQILVDSLDDHGFLSSPLAEIAALSDASVARVERVLAILQQQEPAGIGARSVKECLLLQLSELEADGGGHPLARALIGQHWESLAKGQLERIADSLAVSKEEVREALAFIQANLNPYPAHAYAQARQISYPRPEIRIRRGENGGFLIEFPEEGRYRFHINPSYQRLLANSSQADPGAQAHLREQVARAELFMRAYQQRWETLRRVVKQIVQEQREYFARGEGTSRRRPLTRAQLAQVLGLHESTVSRAVAHKYAQLPWGSLAPLADFFASAPEVKERLREIVVQEERPLSDSQIAALLRQEGHAVARRTVAKYRGELGILPAPLRRAGGSGQ